MSIKRDILIRVRIAFLGVFIFSIAVVFRVIYIQYVQGDTWRGLAKKIGLQPMPIKATRGNIFADDGSLLATSLPFYQVAIDPTRSTDGLYKSAIDSFCIQLSRHFGDYPASEYRRRIDQARREKRKYMILNKEEIGFQDKKKIEGWPLVREGRLKGGVIFEKIERRFLPFSQLGYRTIGSINSDNQGVSGLERSFDAYLAGKDGQAMFQKMSGGGWRQINSESGIRPTDGLDIQTTLNVNLQDITEAALLKALVRHRADYGVVIVMEVATGEIKAMSNLTRNQEGSYFESYNYAVGNQGLREPGSTFKLASIIAVLEEANLELTDTVFTGKGQFRFYDQIMRDHKPEGHGMITIQQAIEYSSNIGIARLVQKHFGTKPEAFINYLKQMGLSAPLNFQMLGEGKPYIKNPSDSSWSGTTLPWMAHGYEVQMTPLHTLALYNAVANNGKMIQPIIVKAIRRDNKVLEEFEPAVIKSKICSSETLSKVQEMLEGVVENGTAMNIKNDTYRIAGKTGTAKTVRNGKYTNEYYTSFVGYFPAHAPKYSCIVVIDDPKGYQIYGSDVSAPVFKEIADKIYVSEKNWYEELPSTRHLYTEVFPYIKSGKREELQELANKMGLSNHIKNEASDWVKTEVIANSVFWNENEIRHNKVPDVRGMTLKDALFLLENVGLEVFTEGNGRVSEQSLPPGIHVNAKRKITLKLG